MSTLRALFANNRSRWVVFGSLALFATAWAIYTQHVWEDYYITYRASKNLATGHGLTFTVGERVHSFTSPLGVLLPALASLLTGNSSDTAALWIFRAMSICCYAGAGTLLWVTMTRLFQSRWPAVVLIVLYGIETKIVDNATNGMESGIVGLFLAWMLYACLTAPKRQVLQIGLAWAGLMWSRPDSFIYIGFFGIGLLLWPIGETGWAGRKTWLRRLVLAGLVTTAVYLPWLVWAGYYYGTPVPHTVTAKGLGPPEDQVAHLTSLVVNLPAQILSQKDMFRTIFMPPYSHNTGWPSALQGFSYWLSISSLVIWLLPGVRREIRAVSLTYFGGITYLVSFVGFPVPWYLPTPTTLCLVSLAMLLCQLLDSTRQRETMLHRRLIRPGAIVLSALTIAVVSTVTVTAAYHLKWQQKIVERGNREPIGRWLAEQSDSPAASIFLEPLGYIGFYSGLKMLDFPGLSSPEVIEARRRAGYPAGSGGWPMLIMQLRPTWLVLRPYEVESIDNTDRDILNHYYQLAREFDVRDQVDAVPHLWGKGYLGNDAHFLVYRVDKNKFLPLDAVRLVYLSDVEAISTFENNPIYSLGQRFGAHAPSRLAIPIPEQAAQFTGRFGIEAPALEHHTDGAEFILTHRRADGTATELLRRYINPVQVGRDRGEHTFAFPLDPRPGDKIELEITPGPHDSNAADWTYWSHLGFPLRQ